MSYIAINDINKSFGSLKALSDINISIEKGQLVSLLGPSGCGKSTLLRIIAGLETSDRGVIYVDGKDISGIPVNKRNMGMVFQSYSLFPNLNAEENIAFGLKLKKLPKDEIDKRVKDIIELVELTGREKHYPNQLSGGQQQRVALARALVVNPEVLLLDEPLSALDAKIRVSLRQMIRDIQQKLHITTIFVTHDQEEALSISDEIFIMENGYMVQKGTPEEIYSNPKTEFVAGFLGTFNSFEPEFLKEKGSDKKIFVRPEHIGIVHINDCKDTTGLYKGKINELYFLGNVVRISVLVDSKVVLVDSLNKDIVNLKKGEEVYLKIDKDKYIYIG